MLLTLIACNVRHRQTRTFLYFSLNCYCDIRPILQTKNATLLTLVTCKVFPRTKNIVKCHASNCRVVETILAKTYTSTQILQLTMEWRVGRWNGELEKTKNIIVIITGHFARGKFQYAWLTSFLRDFITKSIRGDVKLESCAPIPRGFVDAFCFAEKFCILDENIL